MCALELFQAGPANCQERRMDRTCADFWSTWDSRFKHRLQNLRTLEQENAHNSPERTRKQEDVEGERTVAITSKAYIEEPQFKNTR
jgi:hypothetical protein